MWYLTFSWDCCQVAYTEDPDCLSNSSTVQLILTNSGFKGDKQISLKPSTALMEEEMNGCFKTSLMWCMHCDIVRSRMSVNYIAFATVPKNAALSFICFILYRDLNRSVCSEAWYSLYLFVVLFFWIHIISQKKYSLWKMFLSAHSINTEILFQLLYIGWLMTFS